MTGRAVLGEKYESFRRVPCRCVSDDASDRLRCEGKSDFWQYRRMIIHIIIRAVLQSHIGQRAAQTWFLGAGCGFAIARQRARHVYGRAPFPRRHRLHIGSEAAAPRTVDHKSRSLASCSWPDLRTFGAPNWTHQGVLGSAGRHVRIHPPMPVACRTPKLSAEHKKSEVPVRLSQWAGASGLAGWSCRSRR